MRINSDKIVRNKSGIKVQSLFGNRIRFKHANHKLTMCLAQRNANNGDLVASSIASGSVIAKVELRCVADDIRPWHRKCCTMVNLIDGGHVLVHLDGFNLGYG